MSDRKLFHGLLSAVLILVFLASLRSTAWADVPADGVRKGASAAASTVLDKANYADASLYYTGRVPVDIVKIGLNFGPEAQEYVELVNPREQGFSIGYYDETRIFHEAITTENNSIYVSQREGMLLFESEDFEFVAEFGQGYGVCAINAYGKSMTDYAGNRYYGGFTFTQYNDRAFNVINVLELEDYVKGVVPYEMGPRWPYEALRAQAICARTYVAYNQNEYIQYGFDITDDTASQVYQGILGASELTDAAVDSTYRQFIFYQGELCQIYYFSSDGGATESGANIFAKDRPYLLGKTDPFEAAVESYVRKWEVEKTGDYISRQLRLRGRDIGPVTQIAPEYSSLGNVIGMRYLDAEGKEVYLQGRDSYIFLGVSNCRFTVEKDGDTFYFIGRGWGHNCGMSQWGAYAMAEIFGYDCDEIIRFYFTGVYIA